MLIDLNIDVEFGMSHKMHIFMILFPVTAIFRCFDRNKWLFVVFVNDTNRSNPLSFPIVNFNVPSDIYIRIAIPLTTINSMKV